MNFLIVTNYVVKRLKEPKRKIQLRYYNNRQNYFKVLPNDNGEIIFVGDSQTQNFELAEMFNNIKIKNRGINDDDTKGVFDRLKEITESKPKKIFIEIGVNDLRKGVEIQQIEQNIKLVIKNIQTTSPSSKIYLQTVLPTDGGEYSFKPIQHEIVKLNNRIIQIKGVKIINPYSTFEANGLLKPEYNCGDNLHLSGLGYLKWKEILEPYVKE